MREVPAELRGREVSVRTLTPLVDAVQKRGKSLAALAEGTGYSVEHLLDRRERVAWSAFMRASVNIGQMLDNDESALIGIGRSALENPAFRTFLLPGRLLFSLPEIYKWGVGPSGPLEKLIVVQQMEIAEIKSPVKKPNDAKRLRFVVTMMEGYTCTREFWLMRLGFVESVPRAFGLPFAKVTMTESSPQRASYDIELPLESTLVNRIRQRTSWIWMARRAATELQAANEDLHARYLELQREMEQRKAVEEKLRDLNSELERRVTERTSELASANAELTLFSASVAHDLRAPLRAINGFTSAVIEDYEELLPASAKAQLNRVIANAVKMGALVDALLSLSRITRTEIRRERVDLGEIARNVIDDLRANDPKRVVDVIIGDEGMTALGDPALIRSLLTNLLGNAWKFTRDRSPARIELGVARRAADDDDGGTPRFQVRDNGVGFDMKHAGILFTPFHRLHTATEFDGLGIGLATVDRIIRRHGGKIHVDAAPNAGATFSFTLASAT